MSISVIMVNFNNERYLRRAIDSVVTQSRLPNELLVRDDCSTDGSRQIVAEYAERYSFVQLHAGTANLGPAGNRDTAVRSCSSTYFMTIDSDDWLESGVIESTYRALSNRIDAIVVSSFNVASDELNRLFTIDTRSFCAATRRQQLTWLSARRRSMPGNQIAMPIDLYRHLGGIDRSLELYEDWDFMLRATIAGVPWVHSGIVGYTYRKSGLGISSKSSRWRHASQILRVAAGATCASRFSTLVLRGFFELAATKGAKYLLRRASPVGFN